MHRIAGRRIDWANTGEDSFARIHEEFFVDRPTVTRNIVLDHAAIGRVGNDELSPIVTQQTLIEYTSWRGEAAVEQ